MDAALSVLAETGYDGMTMDLVAAKAKASKGTMYRRWPSKCELVLEAVAHLKRRQVDFASLPDTGTLRADLLGLFKPEPREVSEFKQQVFAGLVTLLSRHRSLTDAVNEVMVKPWVDAHRALMERAKARGEISATVDLEAVSRIAPSLAAYRALILHEPFSEEFLVSLVDGVILPALGMPTNRL